MELLELLQGGADTATMVICVALYKLDKRLSKIEVFYEITKSKTDVEEDE